MMCSNLDHINSCLPENWEARTTEAGRVYYINHHTQTTQWLPPAESWKPDCGLPYGWETGVDGKGKQYYINHVEKTTTREDPSEDPDYIDPPQPREVELIRDPQLGFGFVAGSEKPVIVRFVTEDGPSEGKLLPGDQILKIDDEDVAKAPRERVIELVRSCEHSMKFLVCQPHIDNSSRKSALLTAAKKAKLKSNPSRVRFAEAVTVNGTAAVSPATHESYIPFMPNVLKVFLENGQTKSFKYDNKTTVKDVIQSLQEKLNITAINHFALVLQNTRSSANRLSILHEYETLADIASRPESQNVKCLFRVTFMPKDVYELLQTDSVAFDYFFTQCTNDVIEERFASELKYDVILKLAALHIQQHYSASHSIAKLNLKNLQRDTGLERFLPASVLESTKSKELRKLLSHYMKVNEGLVSGQKQLTELQAKLQYVKILSQLKAFGGKVFVATFVEKKTEVMIIVGPRHGIAEVTNIKNNTYATLARFHDIEYITLEKENDSMQQIVLHLHDTAPMVEVTFSMLNDDIEEFIALVEGYYRLFTNTERTLLTGDHVRNNNTETDVPPYSSTHRVVATSWNYVQEKTAVINNNKQEQQAIDVEGEGVKSETRTAIERSIEFLSGPPPYDKEGKGEKDAGDDTKEETVIKKPENNQIITKEDAPLASPDVSTLSESSSESSTQAVSLQKPAALPRDQTDSGIIQGEKYCVENKESDGSLDKDADSVTDSSILTGIGAVKFADSNISSVTSADGSTSALPMSHSMSARDSRFGVSSFKTFASSPRSSPVLPRSQPPILPTMGGESKSNQITVIKAGLGLDIKDDKKLGDKSAAETVASSDQDKVKRSEDGHGPQKVEEDSSSGDTESVNTTSASPAKLKQASAAAKNVNKETADSAHSFGLHSPEQQPCSEDEFKKLACSFGLHSPEAVSPECLHPSYNPRLFSDGQLYFDPEIIDLTLIPPPVTPDEKDTLMDFSSPTMAVPPPEFKDRNSPSTCQRSESPSFMMDLPSPIREKIDAMIQNDEDLSNHMAAIDALVSAELNRDRKVSEKDPRVSENESDSGNETIASDNVELGHSGISDVIDLSSLAVTEDQPLPHDFDALDIDAFIASMTVPPPPNDGSLNRPDIISTSSGTSVYLESVLTKISDSTSETNKGALELISSPCTLPSSSEPDRINCINTSAGADTLSSSTSGFLSERFSTKDYSALELDDEIAKLVIPPPPVTSDAVLTEIPMVPPVSEVEDVEEDKEKDGSVSEVAPYDSPTALEGTRLVESLRAEYEHRLGSSPSPASAHENSASVNQDLDGNQSLSTSSPYKKGLWQPALVSKSADSSPLHQVTESLAHSRVHNSIGTLPRLLRKRETPPPPPPRRSSMQPQLEKTRVRTSENIGSASLRHVVHQRSFSVPEESTSSCPPVTDSCSSLFNTGILKSDSNTRQSAATQEKSAEKDQQSRIAKNILTPGGSHSSPTFTKQSLAEEAAAVANKFTAMRRVPQKVKARSATIERDLTGSKVQSTFIPSRESLVSKSVTLDRDCSHNLHDMLEVSRSVDDINLQAYKDYKRSSSVSSSDSTKSSSTDSSTRFQSFKSKLKSYVAPSIYKKQQIFSRSSGKDKSDKSDLGAELHKSEYLNTSGCSSPSPSSPRSSVSRHVAAFSEFTTGQHSPLSTRKSQLIDEQTSFSDSSDTKLKTFRTFLGDKSGASPPSIHKTAGIRTSFPHTKVEIPGLSKEKVVSSPKKVALPVVNLSTSVANVSISSAEQLSTAQQSVTIPKGKVLVKAPPAQGAHNGDSSEDQVAGGKPSTEHGADGGGVAVTETGASDKVRVIRSELESKLDCKHFARESSRGSASSERGEELLAALEVFTKYVQSHEYAGETTFTDANRDVEHMVGQLTEMLNKRLSRMSDRVAAADMKALKDSLIQNSRTFVTDSKLLVSSATQSKQKLVHHVNCSVHTLAKILFKSGQIITILNSRDGLKAFGSKVAEVAKAYTVTVEAASQAAGKPLSDPNMKLLMKRATSLAAILSSFMKTLKALETS